MKVNLVVAQGVHEGKLIAVTGPEFLIGRDPHCQLRPASPAVSKQHCGVFARDGKLFIRDYGSTNGTFVNGEQVAGEREIANNDHLKVGPLEFTIRIEATAAAPPPAPKPAAPPKPAAAPAAAATSAAKPAPATAPQAPAVPTPARGGETDADSIAAMLLGMDDETASTERTAEQGVPDGTTVMDMPAVPGQPDGKKDDKKASPNTADTSSAAAAILSKYMRRPRT
jgi:pSer/pThr/pTyr-binding forkhead associated (FHA) protein